MIQLKSQVVVITGGSRGIGAATARLFARAGAKLVINYVRDELAAVELAEELEEFCPGIEVYQCDVSQPRQAEELIEFTQRKFGKVYCVVNNAGIWTHGEIGTILEETWDETMSVNLKGTFNVTNAVVPLMKLSGGGRIINISSTAGQRGEAFHSHYAASKGGLLAFTRSLAVELAPYNILVNAVAPGWVDTDLNSEPFGDQNERSRIAATIPLGRIATPDDVAGAVLFLASDLSLHITGATINVNGGSVLV